MKRHGGNDSYGGGQGNGQGKRQRPDSYREALEAGKYELRMLVSSRNAGGIIGKGGENIKRLRNDFDASLTVPDSQTPERILTVVATIDNVLGCISDVIPRLDEAREDEDGYHEGDVRVLVHQSHAGAVIGRGGSKIKEIREETGTHLKVFSQCCPQSTERVVQINGKSEEVINGIRVIINMLKEIPIKGTSRPYESMFYDPAFVAEYGGFPPDRNYRGPSRGAMGMSAGGMPPYGGAGMGMRGSRNFGGSGNFGGRGPVGLSSFAPLPLGPTQTTQVTIPNELGGTIIGKGGERINRIREESGAVITVEPPQENKERIITISGTQAQIQTAQYLLQQCVRSSIAGRKYLSEH